MRHGPVYKRQPKPSFNLLPGGKRSHLVLVRVSTSYPKLVGRLPTCYSPIRRSIHRRPPEGFSLLHALDLHVLGTPPAFVLSQDQTLHEDRKSTRLNSSHVAISYAVFCLKIKKQIEPPCSNKTV